MFFCEYYFFALTIYSLVFFITPKTINHRQRDQGLTLLSAPYHANIAGYQRNWITFMAQIPAQLTNNSYCYLAIKSQYSATL